MTTKPDNAERDLLLIRKEMKIKRAALSLRDFIEFCMYDPDLPDDVSKSRYDCAPHHQVIIDLFEDVEAGRNLRAALSVAPQHGKTLITSVYGLAWALARNPLKNIILGTYSESRAEQVGEQVRAIIMSKRFQAVFPDFELRKGSKAKDYLGSKEGGGILFRGRGSATTGNACDLFIIDDPIKDHMEANSPATQAQTWEWYCAVVFSRLHTLSCVFIIHTRWSENDLIGRQCDSSHEDADPLVTDKWTYINLPAIIEDQELADTMGIAVGHPLWEKRFSIELLNEAKKQNPETFSALYMGKPVPDEGLFFKQEMIIEYARSQLPENLRVYASSDHALSKKTKADSTVLLIFGVDQVNNIWLLDCVWKKIDPLECANEMCRLMETWKPMTWWAGKDHIVGTLGPFLTKLMQERGIYKTWVQPVSEKGDKQQKAQSIRGRMAMGMVRFPKDAPWFAKAKLEVLKFDKSGHDDFVDAISIIGRQLDIMHGAGAMSPRKDETPKTGTFAWVKWSSERRESALNAEKARAGW